MPSELPPVEPLLERLAEACAPLADGSSPPLQIVGIRTGGAWVAQALGDRLEIGRAPGEIDIGFHRDDFHHRGLPQQIKPTHLDRTEDRTVLLVDDVLHTGRTVRAAINALFEFGRPAIIRLAVLVERPGRELPIQADAVGTHLDLPRNVRVKLTGPEPLALKLVEEGADG